MTTELQRVFLHSPTTTMANANARKMSPPLNNPNLNIDNLTINDDNDNDNNENINNNNNNNNPVFSNPTTTDHHHKQRPPSDRSLPSSPSDEEATPSGEDVELDLSELRKIQSCDGPKSARSRSIMGDVPPLLAARPKSVGDDTERGEALEGLSELVPGLVEELDIKREMLAKANAIARGRGDGDGGGGGGEEEGEEEEFPMDEQNRNIRNLDSMVAVMSMSPDPVCDAGVDGPDDILDDEDDSCYTSSTESSDGERGRETPRREDSAAAKIGSDALDNILDSDGDTSASGSTVARTNSTMGNRKGEQDLDVIEQKLPAHAPNQLPDLSPNNLHRRNQRPFNHGSRSKSKGSVGSNSNTGSPRRPDPPFQHPPHRPVTNTAVDPYHLREEFTTAVHSSNVSLSTATQTAASVSLSVAHATNQMPMCLPNFRPATGCTNASDFMVRCFVARLRSGITVTKHGRSRWCKSRSRVLHIHSDGKCLSWKPAKGETSSKRPPRLDLTTCIEVRHAWTPDPLNPMFTGTGILRQKCESAHAFKSFALIFERRTVDITAVTADQCKVLMEGFSALCFRLQVAGSAVQGSAGSASSNDDGGGKAKSNGSGVGCDKDEGGEGPSKLTGAMSFGR